MNKPNIDIPSGFAENGTKRDFPNDKILNGFDPINRDVLRGDCLNKFIDDTYKGLNGVLELYKGAVLYDSTVTYTNKSLVFDITNNEIKFYHSLQNGNINHALTDADYWEEVNLGGSSRNVGEIISSTLPLTDAGLHLLDGSLLQYGIYKEFIDYIANIYKTKDRVYNPSAFTIVGNPTITDDGVASGFSSSNYLQCSLTCENKLTLDWTCNLGSYFDSASKVIELTNNIFLYFNANSYTLTLQYKNSSDTTKYRGLGSISENTNYRFIWNIDEANTTIKIINLDSNTETNFNVTDFSWTHTGSLTINIKNANSGSIDLKQFSITVDGKEVFSGSKPANYFCTEAEWQQSITDYGSCGKFVYDSTLNTVRLPKVSDILQGTTDVSALGDLVEAGLPNITGTIHQGVTDGYINVDNGFIGASLYNLNNRASGGLPFRVENWSFDASRSSSIYGNSTTVQPQTIKCFVYIVIANSTKTSIQVDIDNIATDLNGKADTDLTNTTDSAKVLMSGMAMPSDKYIDLTLGASGSTYTAPANGWFYARGTSDDNSFCSVMLDNLLDVTANITNVASRTAYYGSAGSGIFTYVPVLKGDIVRLSYLRSTISVFRFIYAKGSESEAN